MSRKRLSREDVMRVIASSEDAMNQLRTNVTVMDSNVNSNLSGLQDPTVKKYLELSDEMQTMIKQIGGKMEEISEYCKSVIRWMDGYSDV